MSLQDPNPVNHAMDSHAFIRKIQCRRCITCSVRVSAISKDNAAGSAVTEDLKHFMEPSETNHLVHTHVHKHR